MSKASLKKALEGFNEPELRRVILDLYSKSKEAKELLDFYAEPDLDRKFDQFCQLANKEMLRMKHRAFAPKISALRSIVKKFKIYEPGDEYVGRLMTHIAAAYTIIGAETFLPDKVAFNAIAWFDETVKFLEDHMMADEYIPRLRRNVESMNEHIGRYPNPLRKTLLERLKS